MQPVAAIVEQQEVDAQQVLEDAHRVRGVGHVFIVAATEEDRDLRTLAVFVFPLHKAGRDAIGTGMRRAKRSIIFDPEQVGETRFIILCWRRRLNKLLLGASHGS
jgi:hypothetical protein